MSKIIEINGIKMELDERTAMIQKIDTFKVGMPVKILHAEYSHTNPTIKFAVIVGFDQFKALPTITVAYLDYSEIKYAYINASSKHELLAVENHDLAMEKTWVIDRMQDRIVKKEQELADEKTKMKVFIEMFGKYFKDGMPTQVAQS